MASLSLPSEIERRSMEIILSELDSRGLRPSGANLPVVLRCIHATADFDYAETLRFSPGAVASGIRSLKEGASIVTDTNMALAGISASALRALGGQAFCYMSDPAIAVTASEKGCTRAAAAMDYAAQQHPFAIRAVGNAPTALFRIADQIENGLRPPLVIGVPVGFVNVMESKEHLIEVCERFGVPYITALGRKGGSSVAAAVCNALLYSASDMLDPSSRGWK